MYENKDIWDDIESQSHGESLDEEMFEFISAYADGECTLKERRLVEAYLSESRHAQRLLADIRSTGALFQSTTHTPPDLVTDQIFAKTTRRARTKRTTVLAFASSVAFASALTAALVIPAQNQPAPNFSQRDRMEGLSPESLPTQPLASGGHVIPGLSPNEEVDPRPRASTATATTSNVANLKSPSLNVNLSENSDGKTSTDPKILTAAFTGAIDKTASSSDNTSPTQTMPSIYSPSSKAMPQAPDTVVMTSKSEGNEPPPLTNSEGNLKNTESEVLPDALKRLREELKKGNNNKGVKESLGNKLNV